MYSVTRIDRDAATLPAAYIGHSRGFSRQPLVDRSSGSPHMAVATCYLEPGGYVEEVVHSFEVSIYVLSGELAVAMLGSSTRLGEHHCVVIPVGVAYSIHAPAGTAHWLHMNAPAEVEDPQRRPDTFFTGQPAETHIPAKPDLRDPRNQHAFRFDPASMDLNHLAIGSDVEAASVSASMATALLAYSGIGVRMLIDRRVGAQLHTMFMVDYQPTAIAHPHDHPFEEAYIFVEGEVEAIVDGDVLVMRPGDVLWAGVGADHGFHNRSNGLVRWIETQAPQPPDQHSYRFSRDWEYLAQVLAAGRVSEGHV